MKWAVLVVLLATFAIAHADDPSAPWAAGVSETEQATALSLYEQGNVEFQAARFRPALVLYTQALTHWNHPAIHFNMAVCLINLDQPLEAFEHLLEALAYAEAPLGPEMYARGLTYRHALEGQIAQVSIACNEPGATISLDGVFAFTAPGSVRRRVLPGNHQIVATKPGFQTATKNLQLFAKSDNTYELSLVPLEPATTQIRYWEAWKPWTIVGGGIVVGLVGVLFETNASESLGQYDRDVASNCPHGCTAEQVRDLDLRAPQRRGERDQTTATVLFAVGGVALATGIVGSIINMPRTVVEKLPTISPTQGGATAQVGWRF
ncbi:MAG: PEGA domain-containing protein [Kofleriaceae bacterium]